MSEHDSTLRDLAEAHGVHTGFHDLHGHYHSASVPTLRALLTGLGVDHQNPDRSLADIQRTKSNRPEAILKAGQASVLPCDQPCDWNVTDDTGTIVAEGKATDTIHLPPLPVGYYHLHHSGGDTFLLVKPEKAPMIASDSCWGMTGALYGLRSETNGGLGNYTDLTHLVAGLGAQGAAFFGINPVSALGLGRPDIVSPYSPSHRGFFNTDHIALPAGLGPTPQRELIDYDSFRQTQRAALRQAFDSDTKRTEFEAWRKAAGPELAELAQFDVLTRKYGADFRQWPTQLQTPSKHSAKEAGPEATFHMWLQWLADQQIAAAQNAALNAGMGLGLYLDLAVGPRTDGAEVWMNEDTIAQGVTVGAPPDHLSPEGQSWALAAHAPSRLAAEHYKPLRMMLAKLMSKCGLLRIDHALGLARSFWLPEDGSPGGYITQPFESLLAVILIEAHTASCVVVGEDLGLVPNGFREAMNAAGLYSYAVWQFEGRDNGSIAPAHELASQALACFSTHDTPTLSGFWHGSDIEWWAKVGWLGPNEQAQRHNARAKQRSSLRQVCDLPASAPPLDAMDKIHSNLAASPSALVSVQLEDALGLIEAQNLPGTIDEHPNWRRRLPIPVADIPQDKGLQKVVKLMQHHRPTRKVHS